MYTRQDYMNNKCSFEDYYRQMVTNSDKIRVRSRIGIDKLKEKYSEDKNLNNIPLRTWDIMGSYCTPGFKKYGDWDSLAGRVYIMKMAAIMVIEEGEKTDE